MRAQNFVTKFPWNSFCCLLGNKKTAQGYTYPKAAISSSIQTLTVGTGITPVHAFRLAGSTAGRDFHPALKIIYLIISIILHKAFIHEVCL
jgi:hypothetical protein